MCVIVVALVKTGVMVSRSEVATECLFCAGMAPAYCNLSLTSASFGIEAASGFANFVTADSTILFVCQLHQM